MFPTNFFSNNSNSSLHASYANTFGPTTQMELYPRRRQTEFYYERRPMEEYQSRLSEHPRDKLQRGHSSKYSLPSEEAPAPTLRINPPKTSDMRICRNSYFS